MVAWQPIGISMGVYDMCHRYRYIHFLFRNMFKLPRQQSTNPLIDYKVSEGEEAIRSTTGGFPNQSREAYPYAGQCPSNGPNGLAPLQIV